ncbi:unnamed protein product [Rhizoctonia solani]|uniref:Rho termination factor-like N-terminal domain-containing protein n=1 Tax=Rhizoctonia solani TaxID=456999 RepID=A0A8H3DE37_9AGAM|nr:unnamed protein product [Rhizoctonia solani]
MDHASLSKLNVTKLKEKCKELKIIGYSKLSKPLLIEKILSAASNTGEYGGASSGSGSAPRVGQSNAPPGPQSTEQSTSTAINDPPNGSERTQTIVESSQHRVESDLVTKPAATTKKRPGKNKEDNGPAKKKTKTKKVVDTSDLLPQVSNDNSVIRDNPTQSKGTNSQANILHDAPDRSKECPVVSHPPATSNVGRFNGNLASRTGLAPVQPSRIQTKAAELTRPTPATIPYKPKGPSCPKPSQNSIPRAIHPRVPSPSHTRQTQNKEPLPQARSEISTPSDLPRKPQTYKPKTFKPPAVLRPPRANHNTLKPLAPEPEPESCPEQSLDFPHPELCTSFPLILMPPSTARRRQAERMSVVFSGITDDEVLRTCVRVSRAWRYAVYLSATHALYRNFPGIRLDSIRLQIKEPRMTNMWTYLCARRLETSSRYDAFRGSWLGRFFATEMSGHEPISWRIWTSPDDDRQIIVALRFISTRVVFSLARRYNECDRSWAGVAERVVGAEEIVPDEIWKVTTASRSGALKSFHILYDTGEVIGLAPPSPCRGIIGQRIKHRPHIEVLDSEPGELRADWRGYILSAGSGANLPDMIVSGDRESYVAGVSAFWLRGLSLEDDGPTRRTVARRYVLSCVEPNSVCGEYKSVIDMAGDVAGVVSHSANRKSGHQVGLYISE